MEAGVQVCPGTEARDGKLDVCTYLMYMMYITTHSSHQWTLCYVQYDFLMHGCPFFFFFSFFP